MKNMYVCMYEMYVCMYMYQVHVLVCVHVLHVHVIFCSCRIFFSYNAMHTAMLYCCWFLICCVECEDGDGVGLPRSMRNGEHCCWILERAFRSIEHGDATGCILLEAEK